MTISNINTMQQTMREAMRVMRTGDLNSATEVIQRGLANAPRVDRREPDPLEASTQCIDGIWRVVPEADAPFIGDPSPAVARSGAQSDPSIGDQPLVETGTFKCDAGARDFLIYAPRERGLRPSPVLLMLHGCTQNAADFARGTRMHVQAVAAGYVVVYASQSPAANPNGCWNWFRPSDQRRGSGEPAILAGLVSEMQRRFQSEPGPVFVAGLSAGGAMAATLGTLYPELFRGVGVHSGLPYGCARDVPSALTAMRSADKEVPRADIVDDGPCRVPTIVFHGDRDHTVNVGNAHRVVDAALRLSQQAEPHDTGDAWSETATIGQAAGGRRFTTSRFLDASGKPWVERWIVHGAGHAWYGGDGSGTYTDPKGPDATAEMLRFFAEVG